MSKHKTMTLKDLREKIGGYPDSVKVIFGDGNLSINQVRWRGKKLVQIEFNEIYEITMDPDSSD